MPIYEFVCKQCSREAEILVASSDWKGTKCPACGSTRLQKKLSAFAVAAAPTGGAASAAPACSGNPSACGRCSGFSPN